MKRMLGPFIWWVHQPMYIDMSARRPPAASNHAAPPGNGSPPTSRASQAVPPMLSGEQPLRREGDSWLDRWIASVADLARLKRSHPMLDAVIDEVDGRRIRIGNRWLADFASCNYLGLDWDREVMAAIPKFVDAWGTHPSWSRLLGSPVLYEQLEERLTELLGCQDTLLLPTITHIHMSVIPVLAGNGVILMDGRAHKTIFDGCSIARGHGATVKRYRHNDFEQLEGLLRACTITPRVIATDGVNSMTGNAPDVRELARLAREYDAVLYIDDAHGFGVIGERHPDELCDYGVRGNSLIRHQGETYENIVVVAGMSKAYSSLLAFIGLSSRMKDVLKVAAPPYLFSGPSPVASLATAWVGMDVNESRGDRYRAEIHRKTHRVMDRLSELGIYTPNGSGFPIIEIPLANHEDIDVVGHYLFDHGIYVTMAAYPLVPKHEVGFRIQVTAANEDSEVDRLCEVLGDLDERFDLQHDEHRELMRAGARLPAWEEHR
jgi:8-amino-7-oxononanoate synthase